MWSATWDRTLDDIFAIQDGIAGDVVAELQITLLGAAPKVEDPDPDAYTRYLQARHLGRQSTAPGYEQSNALYTQALAIDPEYAAAWAGLASNYASQAAIGLKPNEEGFELAREAANRALAIDPDFAPAYAVLGRIAKIYDGDLAVAAHRYQRALDLEPTNTGILSGPHHWPATLAA